MCFAPLVRESWGSHVSGEALGLCVGSLHSLLLSFSWLAFGLRFLVSCERNWRHRSGRVQFLNFIIPVRLRGLFSLCFQPMLVLPYRSVAVAKKALLVITQAKEPPCSPHFAIPGGLVRSLKGNV